MLTMSDFGVLGRRDFLRVGSLGLGGLSLANLAAAPLVARAIKDKAVVFVFMYGGPSQFETFDPKPTAPEGIRTVTDVIPTTVPGIHFGSSFPKIASLADRITVVRSFVPSPDNSNHGLRPIVCNETFDSSLGSAYSSVVGGNHAETGMPTNVMLYPRAVLPNPMGISFGSDRLATPGVFGAPNIPFMPGSGSSAQRDLRLHLPLQRLQDRRALLKAFDSAQAALDQTQRETADVAREKAFTMLLRGVGDAFDLSREHPGVLARYDTEPLLQADALNPKLLHYRDFIDHARSFGKLMLLARRLCERGAGFVTLTTNFVWDMHADEKNLTIRDGMRHVGGPFDRGISAFLEDIEARGLSEKILLVCCGEMGRTPIINRNGGRDHWGNLGTLLLAGGGLRMGQVIGQSTGRGGEPRSDPIYISHLISTIMNTVFDIGQLRLIRGVSREVVQMGSVDPIPGLHG